MENKQRIIGYKDLEVFRNTYEAMLIVHKEILPYLKSKDFDLHDQISRSTKSAPRLIAEGYGKKHQAKGFQKYLDDAICECNESCVSLLQTKDIYGYKPELCLKLADVYDKSARQCFLLAASWDKFSQRRSTTTTNVTRHDQRQRLT